MRTQWRSSRPSTRNGFGWPASATTRSTSSTTALTRRSLGAEAITNSSATTRTSPTSRITTSRAPFESAARAATAARSRACTRSLVRLLAVLPPDQIRGVGTQDHGHIDLVVVGRLAHGGRVLLDLPDAEPRSQPRRPVALVGAFVEHQGFSLIEGGGVSDDGYLGPALDQSPRGGAREVGVGRAVEQADADPP